MCHTQELWLENNKIGDAGLTALAKAVESGALPKCTTISMGGNPASDEAKTSVKRALKDRWLDGDFIVKNLSDVESLDCSGLGWGDAEMLKLASAIEHAHASGALDNLEVSWPPTALSPCLETWHAHSPDSEHLFDVPCAETLARGQQHWRRRPHRSRQGG